MILYNVTVSVDAHISEDWLQWMRAHHIPEVMATGCFIESRLSRVHGEEEGGVTYSVMYVAPDQTKMDEYQHTHAPALQRDHAARYQGKFAAFRTTLSIIEEYK